MESQSPRNDLGRPHRGALGGAIIGLLIIGFGLNLLAGNLGWTDAQYVFRMLWPVGLVLLGVAFLLQQRKGLWGVALILAGVWAYADQQHWLRVNFWQVFVPTLIVVAGASVIWRGFHRPRPPQAAGDAYIRTYAIMSGSEMRPTALFEGADLNAVLGGAKLDLTAATLSGDSVVVDVFAMMGGIEIHVPRDWDVTIDVASLMGACVDKRSPSAVRSGKQLIVHGYTVMGGVEIKD
jgi:predicted membrane protein